MRVRAPALATWAVAALFLGSACATTQEAGTSSSATSKKRKKKRPKAPTEGPIAVDGDEDAADGPPPGFEGEVEEGVASFYADSLAGNRTANGERYRPDKRTCAHRKHAFGTMLHITAVESGATATCRVNDRGPYAKNRILDVSKQVARELGMIDAGVLRVRVQNATPPAAGEPEQ